MVVSLFPLLAETNYHAQGDNSAYPNIFHAIARCLPVVNESQKVTANKQNGAVCESQQSCVQKKYIFWL
jgi:hypothetical protein